MENNRPRGREKHVTGPARKVQKQGEGLGTGPVGEAGGYSDRKQGGFSGTRSAGTRGGGGVKLIGLLLVLLLGGGGGLTALLGGTAGGTEPLRKSARHKLGPGAGRAGRGQRVLGLAE